MKKVIINQFAERQFSATSGRWTMIYALAGHVPELKPVILELVRDYFKDAKDGFREGVKIVRIPITDDCIVKGIIPIASLDIGDKVDGVFDVRRDGEEGHIQINRSYNQDKNVFGTGVDWIDVVIYNQEILDSDRSTEDAEWEIVSINGGSKHLPEEIPMDPVTMARNQLGKVGGTKTEYPASVWAESVWFWSRHAWTC